MFGAEAGVIEKPIPVELCNGCSFINASRVDSLIWSNHANCN